MDPEDVMLRRADHLVARWNHVLVWVSVGPFDDALLRELRDHLRQVAAEHPRGGALLVIARGQSELPKLDLRRTIARGLASLGEGLQCVAAAFEGSPRWVDAARSLVERLLAMAPGPFPMRVFGDREEAILWLGEVVLDADGRPLESAALGPFVEDAIAALQEGAGA